MRGPQQITKEQLAKLLFDLISSVPADTDVKIIASFFNQVMTKNELRFKPYFEVLREAADKYLITPFETTEDFFYSAITAKNIYQGKIEYWINLTIKF